jgi:hypothetical protein
MMKRMFLARVTMICLYSYRVLDRAPLLTLESFIARLAPKDFADQTVKDSRLHDHNGVLYVDWAQRPTPTIRAVIDVWGIHENEPVTNHFERGVELIGVAERFNPFAITNDATFCL